MNEVEGLIQFFVSISVDAAAMKEWPSERIEAFFRGAALMQSAARKLEAAPSPGETPPGSATP